MRLIKQLAIVLTLGILGATLHFAAAQSSNQQAKQAGQPAGQVGPSVIPSASPSVTPTGTPTATPGISPTATPTVSPSTSPAVTGEVITTTTTALGEFLVDGSGRSVYAFLGDTANSGASNCNDTCAAAWPPVVISGAPQATGDVQAGQLGTITRNDGSTQVTYFGQPLYYYSGDTGPGMTNGEGLSQFGALWWLVKPDGTNLMNNASPSPSVSPSASPAAGTAGSGGSTGSGY